MEPPKTGASSLNFTNEVNGSKKDLMDKIIAIETATVDWFNTLRGINNETFLKCAIREILWHGCEIERNHEK